MLSGSMEPEVRLRPAPGAGKAPSGSWRRTAPDVGAGRQLAPDAGAGRLLAPDVHNPLYFTVTQCDGFLDGLAEPGADWSRTGAGRVAPDVQLQKPVLRNYWFS